MLALLLMMPNYFCFPSNWIKRYHAWYCSFMVEAELVIFLLPMRKCLMEQLQGENDYFGSCFQKFQSIWQEGMADGNMR